MKQTNRLRPVRGPAPLAVAFICSSLALLARPALASAPDSFRILHAERVELSGMPARARAGAVGARFDAYGRRFQLALVRNDRVLPQLAGSAAAPQVYRGELAGLPGSWARVTVANGRRYGMVWDGSDLYVIEPAEDAARSLAQPSPAAAGESLVYRLSDTLAPAGGVTCGASEATHGVAARTGLDAYRAMVGELRANAAAQPATGAATAASTPVSAAVTATQRLQITAVADSELAAAVGVSGARDRIAARINNLDGIFSSQVGVQIELVGTVAVFTSVANDPFTTTVPESLLRQVGTYRQQLAAPRGGLTHLFTGSNLDGTTVGIAFIGSLCSTNFGVSLSEALNSFGTLIAAHELGHNFGAPHDGEGACATTPANQFLMAPSVNGNDQFSQCSLDQMQIELRAANCLLPASNPVDLGVSSDVATVNALVGRAFTLAATVSNLGTASASGAELRVTLPPELTAIDGTATGGSCSIAAPGIVCTWATLAGAANSNVTLTLRGDQTGSSSVTATVVAAGDTVTGNDSTSWAVTINPLPDVALQIPLASAAVNVGADTTLTANVRNDGNVQVDTVQFTATLPANVTLSSATPASACTIAGRTANCTVSALLAGQSRSINLQVRGASAGTADAQFSISSAEDGTAGNNAGTISVVVSDPAPAPTPTPTPTPAPSSGGGGGGGGGGSFSGAELLALAALAALRRRRPR